MANTDIRGELSSLERKVLLLVSEHKKTKQEIVQLKQQNQDLKTELHRKSEQIGSFQNNLKMSSIVDSMVVNDNNTAELKQVINDYIKEVDKCIAQLSQ
jgi:DNA-binding protein H-NS